MVELSNYSPWVRSINLFFVLIRFISKWNCGTSSKKHQLELIKIIFIRSEMKFQIISSSIYFLFHSFISLLDVHCEIESIIPLHRPTYTFLRHWVSRLFRYLFFYSMMIKYGWFFWEFPMNCYVPCFVDIANFICSHLLTVTNHEGFLR